MAKTNSLAQQEKAIGAARAAAIFAKAYSQNIELFSMYRSLLAYEASFKSKKDILVLDQSSAFFDYFKSSHPEMSKNDTKK